MSPLAMEVFRIAFGALLLVDLAMRYLDLGAHYTTRGVLPMRIGFGEYLFRSGRLDVFLLSDSGFFHHLLFLAGLGGAVCFCLGIVVRPAQVIVWLVLLGAQNQNPLLNAGADIYVRVILFWSFFLPLGRALSLWPRRRKKATPRGDPSPVEALGFYAYSAQLGIVYLCSFLVKWSAPYWRSGDALSLALQVDVVRGPLAPMLLSFPQLLSLLTYLTLGIQLAAALLFVMPPQRLATARTAVVLALMCMHFGIMASLSVGLFPYYAVASLLPLFPRSLTAWLPDQLSALPPSGSSDPGRPALLTGPRDWVKMAGIVFGVLFVPVHLLSHSIQFPPGPSATRALDGLGRFTGLHQQWVMFSAIEYNLYGRVVGYRRDGEVEVLFEIPRLPASTVPWYTGESPPRYEFASSFSGYRWKKFFVQVLRRENPELFQDLTAFLCRDTDRRSGPDHFSKVRYLSWKERRDWKSGTIRLESHRDKTCLCPSGQETPPSEKRRGPGTPTSGTSPEGPQETGP